MADNGKDLKIVNATMSSPDSVDILIPSELNETSTSTSPKIQHLVESSATIATQSLLKVDNATSVVTSTVQLTPEIIKSRFSVTRLPSSELPYQKATTPSPSKIDESPSQSPKSVQFTEQVPSTSKAKPPQHKSPRKKFMIGDLSKPFTIAAKAKTPERDPPSPVSLPTNQEIELQPMNRGLTSSPTRRLLSEEESFDIVGDRSEVPLLDNSERDNAGQSDMRRPGSRVGRISGEEIPNSTSREGTSTRAAQVLCNRCNEITLYMYVGIVVSFVIAFFLGATTVYCYYHFTGRINHGVMGRGHGSVNINHSISSFAALVDTTINESFTSISPPKDILDTTTLIDDSPATTEPITSETMTNQEIIDSTTTKTTAFVPETSAERSQKKSTHVN